MMTLKQHPLSSAYPRMSSDEMSALTADIKAHGLRDPITLYQGMVIDGWHRYLACQSLECDADAATFAGDDPVAFVRSKNMFRRHLTGSQRAAAEVACNEWAAIGRPVINSIPGIELKQKPLTAAQMAKAAGTSVQTISDAKLAHKAGNGEDVRDGKITAKAAAGRQPNRIPGIRLATKKEMADAAGTSVQTIIEATDGDDYTPMDALYDQIGDLQAELAVANMGGISDGGKLEAADLIADLRKHIKALEIDLKAVKTSRDTYQNENAELKKQITRQRKEIDKLTGGRTA